MEQATIWALYVGSMAGMLLFVVFLIFYDMTGLSTNLLLRVRRAEEAQRIWEQAEWRGCPVSELPNPHQYMDKAPVTAEHLVRWAGMGTRQVVREYLKMWWENRGDLRRQRRARQQALVREMEEKSKEV